MRILHTSDWHIGRKLKEHDRTGEFIKFFAWLENIIASENIDVLLVSGDIFDTTTPSTASQNIYYSFLSRLAESFCRHTIIISGNHDSPAFLDAPADLLKLSRIHVIGSTCPSPEDEVITLRNESGQPELVVCAVPYLRDRDVRTSSIDDDFTDIEHALKAGIREHYAKVFSHARESSHGVPVIAMGHLFVQGGRARPDEGERSLYVGTAVNMESGIFPEDIIYTALGHLHSPQSVGRENIRYSGSPIAMTFGEAKQEKSVYVVELEGNNLAGIRNINVPVFQRLERISGNEQELEAQIDILGRENISIWIEATYTGDEIIADLKDKLNDYAKKYSELEIVSFEDNARNIIPNTYNFSGKSLEEFSPEKIFEQLLDSKNIPEDQRIIFRRMYQEILHIIEAREAK